MKEGRIIRIKHPLLQNLRKNLRLVLCEAVLARKNKLIPIEDFQDLPESRWVESHKLSADFKKSICQCKSSGVCESIKRPYTFSDAVRWYPTNLNMIYCEAFDTWYCKKCYKRLLKSIDVQNITSTQDNTPYYKLKKHIESNLKSMNKINPKIYNPFKNDGMVEIIKEKLSK